MRTGLWIAALALLAAGGCKQAASASNEGEAKPQAVAAAGAEGGEATVTASAEGAASAECGKPGGCGAAGGCGEVAAAEGSTAAAGTAGCGEHGAPADGTATAAAAGCGEHGAAAEGSASAAAPKSDEEVVKDHCKHEVPEDAAKAAAAAPVADPSEADKAKAAEIAALAAKTKHFGEPLTLQTFAAVGDVAAKPDEWHNKPVKLDATIKSVCKKAGCWMILSDGTDKSPEIRVKMKNHAFFVPRDCDGKRAVVEGIFMKAVTPEAVLKHYEEDAGRDPSLVKGDKVELTMIASGVDLIEP